jgi:hypothetical protein
MATVDPQALPLTAAGANQAAGVEQFDESGVVDVLIEIVEQGEVHGRDLRASSCIPVEDTTAWSNHQEAEHRIPLMSHGRFSRRLLRLRLLPAKTHPPSGNPESPSALKTVPSG